MLQSVFVIGFVMLTWWWYSTT